MPRPVLLNAVQTAALLSKSVPWACRAAKAGKFGPPVIDPGQKRGRYPLAAIEATSGQKFSAEQIERALAAHDYRGPTKAELIATLHHLRRLRFIKARDEMWRQCLAEQGITKFKSPPFPNVIPPKGNPL